MGDFHNSTRTQRVTGKSNSCGFVFNTFTTDRSISTSGEQCLYAIKWAHNCAGLTDPTENSYVTSLQEAARRKANHGVHKKEPITKDILITLCDKFIDEKDLLIVRNLTMILFCFAGFLRFDEVSSLTFNDIIMRDDHIVLCIKKSKTDQYRQGSEVLIAKGSTSACPVSMYLRYLDLLSSVEDKSFFPI